MKKELSPQLELFTPNGQNNQQPQFTDSLLRRLRAYEKLVLVIIGFFISGIVFFSLGVKRGQAGYRRPAQKALAKPEPENIQKQDFENNIINTAIKEAPAYKKETAVKELLRSGYTIQVASFANKENALKESSDLKRKGLPSLVLPKGKFNIVCVGNFPKRQDAESMLPKFKKQYQDCRIRRL